MNYRIRIRNSARNLIWIRIRIRIFFGFVTALLFTGIFTFHGSGAVKRFVITTSVSKNLTTNNKLQAANRFGKMTEIINKSVYFDILEKQKCLCEGDPELSMTRNCRVHCIY